MKGENLLTGTDLGNALAGQARKARRKTSPLVAYIGAGDQRRQISVTEDRVKQTLRALAESGARGITALEVSSWALRLGHYVFLLRKRYGVNIQTINEPHSIGGVNGHHARYRALDPVAFESDAEARAA